MILNFFKRLALQSFFQEAELSIYIFLKKLILKRDSTNLILNVFFSLTSMTFKSQGVLLIIIFIPICTIFLPIEFKSVVLKSELPSFHFHKFLQLELNWQTHAGVGSSRGLLMQFLGYFDSQHILYLFS